MRRVHRRWRAWSLWLACAVFASLAGAQEPPRVAFDQRLGATLPLDAPFTDMRGHVATLREILAGRPAIVVAGYYACPNLCDTVRSALRASLARVDLAAGDDYRVVAVSIDPGETAADAQQSAGTLGAGIAPRGWHFLTGTHASSQDLAAAIGFHYVYDAALRQYAHPAGIVVVTPAGTVSRYFFGVDYPPADLRASLVAATGERVGNPVRALLLRCFHYDPAIGKHTSAVVTAMRLFGLALAAALALTIAKLARRERARRAGAVP
jgi:protein SCO1